MLTVNEDGNAVPTNLKSSSSYSNMKIPQKRSLCTSCHIVRAKIAKESARKNLWFLAKMGDTSDNFHKGNYVIRKLTTCMKS